MGIGAWAQHGRDYADPLRQGGNSSSMVCRIFSIFKTNMDKKKQAADIS